MSIGQVIGSTTLKAFRFVIKEGAEEHVKRDEFVSVAESVTGNSIIGVIKEIVISNELLPDEFGRDMRVGDIILSEGEYPVPMVKVLGYETPHGLEPPRHGIKPGSMVELASDEQLNRILAQDASKAAYIGTLATRESVPVYLDVNELVSRHCAVLAMTGAGKSYTVGVLIEELMKKKGAIVVFDLHGEFKGMQFEKSQVRVYGVESDSRIQVEVSALSVSDYANLMTDLTASQRDLLDELLGMAYRFYEKYDLEVLRNIIDILYDLKKEEGQKKAKEDAKKADTGIFPEGVLRSMAKKASLSTIGALARRIKRLERIGVFKTHGTPLKEVVRANQLTVINLSEAEEGVSEIIVAALCRNIFDSRKRHSKGDEGELETPTFIVVEEAHTFAPRAYTELISPSRNILRKIAREGRKFGVGLCIISQRPNKLDADVLSQCNTQVIMKIVNPSDQEYIRQSVETVTEDIIRDLPGLGRGEAVVAGSAVKMPVSVKIRQRETVVGGSDLDVVELWKAQVKEG
ncbi:MAG: ATP-binding protein [Candidatus Altiarchaeota archaeon]|nr:ATP-binding protein [Candidatus Altiarchaeota archaeon]